MKIKFSREYSSKWLNLNINDSNKPNLSPSEVEHVQQLIIDIEINLK